MKSEFDGWATKANLMCSDGRTIMHGAFQHQDGSKVPLVWNHQHNEPGNIIGHAYLQHRDEGVYAYAYLNETERAQETRELLRHGDVDQLSIYANKLKQDNRKNVQHGDIKEVSVVLSGANPGAYIQNVNLAHSDDETSDEAIIYTGLELVHADSKSDSEGDTVATDTKSGSGKTVKDVVESMSEEQKNVLYYLLGEAVEGDSAEQSDFDNSESLAHNMEGHDVANVFEGTNTQVGDSLSHAQKQAMLNDAAKLGSLHEAVLMHAENYGINNIELLFPEAKSVMETPEFIKRETEWVSKVLSGTTKRPFSRIKSMSADITHEEARARGYIKGNLKKEEFFGLTSRKTGPTTIYKKQKLDRDDIIDATEINVVSWLWAEMRLMLNEEIARAILIGDGRSLYETDGITPNPDKIKEPSNTLSDGDGIRAIANEHDFYAHQVTIPAGQDAANMIKQLIRERKNYKGSGNPSFFTTEDLLTDMLLLEDKMGRRLYETNASLASALRVKEIIPVEVMETVPDLLGIMVNLSDYIVGTDKGGEITTFDDFDIDYNQYKYLIEGRMSGTLVKYKTAVVIRRGSGTQVEPTAPTYDDATDTLTIPGTTGVQYLHNGDQVAAGDIVIDEDAWVQAVPKPGYYFEPGSTTDWTFTYTA